MKYRKTWSSAPPLTPTPNCSYKWAKMQVNYPLANGMIIERWRGVFSWPFSSAVWFLVCFYLFYSFLTSRFPYEAILLNILALCQLKGLLGDIFGSLRDRVDMIVNVRSRNDLIWCNCIFKRAKTTEHAVTKCKIEQKPKQMVCPTLVLCQTLQQRDFYLLIEPLKEAKNA